MMLREKEDHESTRIRRIFTNRKPERIVFIREDCVIRVDS